MSFFDLTFDDSKVQTALERAPGAVFKALKSAMRADGQEWERALIGRMVGSRSFSRRAGLSLADRLGTRSGNLKRGINSTVEGSGPDVEMRAFIAGVPYAEAQEKGERILPKRGKYLTIPIDDNLTATGVARFPSARALDWYKKGSRGAQGFRKGQGTGKAFVLRTKSGGLYIVRDAPGGNLEFLFKLVREAVLPGPETTGTKSRLGFFDTWAELVESRHARHAEAVERALAEATGKGSA